MKLNENEKLFFEKLIDDCEELDDWYFNRLQGIHHQFEGIFTKHQVSGYISDFSKKGIIDICPEEDEL